MPPHIFTWWQNWTSFWNSVFNFVFLNIRWWIMLSSFLSFPPLAVIGRKKNFWKMVQHMKKFYNINVKKLSSHYIYIQDKHELQSNSEITSQNKRNTWCCYKGVFFYPCSLLLCFNCEELSGATEYLMLYTRCHRNWCHYNQVWLHLNIQMNSPS